MRLELLLPTLAALLATFPISVPVSVPISVPASAPAPAPTPVPPPATSWPVGTRPQVVRAWDPPPTPYAAGHRGVDLAAPPGSPVRAVAAGRIAFAGRVAGRGVVTLELTGTGNPPLRTTYEPVTPTAKRGERIAAGEQLGTLSPPTDHCRVSCLHWGLLRAKTYLNPLSLLPPWLLRRGPSRLLPLTGTPALPPCRGQAFRTASGDSPGRAEPGARGRVGTAHCRRAPSSRGLSPARPAEPWKPQPR
ncbi:M23 family metallopeptidase [Streptomyces sp. NPDC041068]|uniref:M23 family metallopeptidase n=1 Tax=Streptomyces sp. NPDC041068 TaxID=3155130 RepID=UPI0033E03D85